MLYDRPYMRQSPGDTAPRKASMVTTLIVITVAVFVLQQVMNVFFPGFGGRDNQFFADWFALSGENFRELKVWTILTYGLFHSSATAYLLFIPIPFAHLVFNMLALYFLGRYVERDIGRERFAYLYAGAVLMGGLSFLIFNINSQSSVIGASAGVSAIVVLFCLRNPEQQLVIIPIPIPIKARWILWGAIAITVFSIPGEISGSGGVSHTAHLGGIIAGILYYRYVHNRSVDFFASRTPRASVELPDWFKRKQKTEQKISYKVNRSNRDELQNEVDRILDKINATGFGSLTENEKETLDRAKDILSR